MVEKVRKFSPQNQIVTTNRESYTQNISLDTVFTLCFSLRIQCQEQDLSRQSCLNYLPQVIPHGAGSLVPCQWEFPAPRGNWACRTATPAQQDPRLLLWEKPAPSGLPPSRSARSFLSEGPCRASPNAPVLFESPCILYLLLFSEGQKEKKALWSSWFFLS